MQDQLAEILAYVKGVVSHKWLIIVTTWFISLAGWLFVYQMPDKYTSEARVHVDTRTMLRPLLRGLAVQADVRGLVAIMQKLMFTQQNMLKIAELAGVEGDYKSEAGKLAIANRLKSGVEISGGRDEIFSISYESTNPVMAQKVVQAVLSVFSAQTQRSTLNDVDSAQRFIEEQIQEYEQRLRNAEKARENFKRANLGLLPGQGEDQISKIQTIQSDLEQIETTVSEMLVRKEVLQSQLEEALVSEDEWGLTDFADQGTPEDARISNLLSQKDELLIKYTENHPYVKAIDSTIEAIEQRIAENGEGLGDNGSGMEAMSNPYVQSIKAQINQVDAEIATLQSRKERYKTKLTQADEEFNSRLAIETEMQNLNRDYESIKRNYLSLIERREQASMSEKVDNQAAALKFRIADPANRPLSPSAPNRELLYSLVLLIGFVVGIAIALSLVLIRPVFTTTRNLRSVTGLPVLGSVSVFMTHQQIKKQRINNLVFVSVSFLLLSSYAGVMTLNFFNA
ncbi:XrtA system polysaccharide chain length determinant [Methylomarinum sp. Ch1-1]|uniref:XrtA system polysaccharide chain length determinant n=1 Tax=Methylomarinum roseum TaxID=3067653 RepID=A0AAU7NPF6_9GAMM|nr:XrtA system polysaccharide chain length determinant [Methylomarinum sp. Ch1-1]MDP4521267.1 GNVR domain-containing protein [Methylomarinum sp. Ch1-1]